MKVFWSWQSDTPGKTGRHFVRNALQAAIEEIRQPLDVEEPVERDVRENIHIDHDRKGVTGSPRLIETIFRKIDNTDVFVSDITPVSRIRAVRKPGQVRTEKRNMNPNVAIELGYAIKAISEEKVLMVLNEHYGGRKFLPFDIQGNAGPILFNLPPDSDTARIRSEAHKLKNHFLVALREFVFKASPAAVEIFQRTPQTTSNAVFFKRGEVLATIGEDSDRKEYQFDTDCGVYLRVSPTAALSAPISKTILFNTMRGAQTGALSNDGWGLFVPNQYGSACVKPDQITGRLDSVTQIFQNGEIWGFAPYLLRDRGFGKVLPMGAIEKVILRALRSYLDVAARLGLTPPYTIEIGAVGIVDYVLSVDQRHPDTSLGPIRDNEMAFTVLLNDASDVAQSAAALKLFQGFYQVSGYPRPPVVNGFPGVASA